MRSARLKLTADGSGVYYHCVSRIVGRQKFLQEAERDQFVVLMREYEAYCEVQVRTYCARLCWRMVRGEYWIDRIKQHWGRRSILWLRGVRRAGKTSLAQSLGDVEYFDCELPRVHRAMEDPETFLEGVADRRIVLDEIHPRRLLAAARARARRNAG